MLCYTILSYDVLYYTTYHSRTYYAMLYHTILYCTVLSSTVLYSIVLYCAILYLFERFHQGLDDGPALDSSLRGSVIPEMQAYSLRNVAEASGFGFESPGVDAWKPRASGNAGSPQPGLAIAYGREPAVVRIQC